jgi:hypothetical protein
MAIVCTRCRESVAANDVNLNTALARCHACAHVFDVRPQVRAESEAEALDVSPQARGESAARPLEAARGESAELVLREPRRPLVARPADIRVFEASGGGREGGYRGAFSSSGELVIERTWRTAQVYPLAAFCLFWEGFLVLWYTRPGLGPGGTLFPLLHLAAGAYLTYSLLAQIFNRTVIRATTREISVRHGPLPWAGNKVVATRDVGQLYCESVASSKSGFVSRSKRREATFRVSAVLRDGSKLPLVGGLPEPDQALFIERRLEEHLDIDDAPVAGELGG